jgi:hypothetical protein
VLVHGELKFVSGAFLDDLTILGVGRLGFAADLFDQFQSRQDHCVKVLNVTGPRASKELGWGVCDKHSRYGFIEPGG